jgi:hypothetical protein
MWACKNSLNHTRVAVIKEEAESLGIHWCQGACKAILLRRKVIPIHGILIIFIDE